MEVIKESVGELNIYSYDRTLGILEKDGVITLDEFRHLDKRSHGYKELLKKYKKRKYLNVQE